MHHSGWAFLGGLAMALAVPACGRNQQPSLMPEAPIDSATAVAKAKAAYSTHMGPLEPDLGLEVIGYERRPHGVLVHLAPIMPPKVYCDDCGGAVCVGDDGTVELAELGMFVAVDYPRACLTAGDRHSAP